MYGLVPGICTCTIDITTSPREGKGWLIQPQDPNAKVLQYQTIQVVSV